MKKKKRKLDVPTVWVWIQSWHCASQWSYIQLQAPVCILLLSVPRSLHSVLRTPKPSHSPPANVAPNSMDIDCIQKLVVLVAPSEPTVKITQTDCSMLNILVHKTFSILCCINYGPTSRFCGICRTRILTRLTFSTYWVSISLSVSFVIDRECTLLRTSASSSSYRLFFDAWTREISFKTSYIAFVASGTYLPFERNYITVFENRNNWVVGLPAQISFSLLLLTSLNFSHYFGFQLDAALLNSRLKKWCC